MKKRLDILIIGGGLIGGSLGCALAQGGLRVGIVDPQQEKTTATNDARMSAIAYGSYQLLKRWGVVDHLKDPPEPIHQIHISQANTSGVLSYDRKEVGGEALGYMIPNVQLRLAIAKRTQAFKNLHRFIPDRVQDIQATSQCVEVTLESEVQLEASLVIAADGKQSPLRQQFGISCMERDYRQQAIIFNLKCGIPHHNMAYEHFMPSGPLAVLPAPNQQVAVVWTQDNKDVQRLLDMPPERLVQAFQSRFGYGLGKLELASKRVAYPLTLLLPKETLRPRMVWIGDAAHAIHPVAGQGVNVGFRDVEALERLLLEHHALGLDLGSDTLLRTYTKARRVDVASMAGVTHGLIHLFSWEIPMISSLRNLGMQGVGKIPPLKRFLINHARGMTS